MHLLIPFANSNAAECQQALAALKLPNLDALLRKLPSSQTDAADETTLSPPHERALAAAFGITAADGQIPFGAYHAAQVGENVQSADAWAVITPCHWAVQTSHITMTHPRALNLGDEESRALLAAMQPYFAEDGIALMYDTPTRWLARGTVFAGLATASPYRVVGGHVDDWLPKAASAKLLRRLQNEMQMLLYTHPLTDARAALGLPAVNSFWVSGTGALPPGFAQSPHNAALKSPSLTASNSLGAALSTPATEPITISNALRDAAIQGDWPGWAQAWQQIDSTECAALLAEVQAKKDVTLTLCGERSAQTWRSLQKGQMGLQSRLMQALRGKFRHFPTSHIISLL